MQQWKTIYIQNETVNDIIEKFVTKYKTEQEKILMDFRTLPKSDSAIESTIQMRKIQP